MPLPFFTSAVVSSVIGSIVNVPTTNVTTTYAVKPDTTTAYQGVMYPPANGVVQIDDNLFTWAPTAQIRNQQNLIVQPAYLQGAMPVRFQFDNQGAVNRVWLLSITQ